MQQPEILPNFQALSYALERALMHYLPIIAGVVITIVVVYLTGASYLAFKANHRIKRR